ncbi:probetacellulin [Trichomycterus rosablanca]|uniref:probetacellulin n=1 Tax=Trichomycterus rosablanca TaxID=2290929 RepID=UPI002F35082B
MLHMDHTHTFLLGFITVALCKYAQAEWNSTGGSPNATVSCGHHDNNSNCTDGKVVHSWSDHFSECPEQYLNYCIHGTCQFVQEQNVPSCRCDSGYVGARCEYINFDWLVEDRTKILIGGIVAVLAFLLFVIAIVCVCINRRKRRRKQNQGDEEKKLNTIKPDGSSEPADMSDTNTV